MARGSRQLREHLRSHRAQIVALATLGLASVTFAVPNRYDTWTATGTASWFTPGDWSTGVPTVQDAVRTVTSGTINIDGTGAAVNTVDFGWGQNLTPTINLGSGASFFSVGDVHLGGGGTPATASSTSATFNQTGGNVAIRGGSRALWVGFGGSGTYNMSGGQVDLGYPGNSTLTNLGMSVGTGANGAPVSTGTLNLSGGTINCDQIFEVARSGSNGVVNITGGTLNVGSDFWGGQAGSGGGLVTVTQSAGAVNVGFNQPGASGYGQFFLGLGNASTKRATYTLSGTGALNVYGYMEVGGGHYGSVNNSGGYGDFVMNGGTVSIGDPKNTAGSLWIGLARSTSSTPTTSNGSVTVNGGTMTFNLVGGVIALGAYGGTTNASSSSTGVMTITGGQVLNPHGFLEIGREGSTGTLNLSGGELSLDNLTWRNPSGNTKTRSFNWTGGILDLNTATTDYPIVNAGGTLRPGGAGTRVLTTTGNDGSYTQNSGVLALDVASNSAYDALDLTGSTIGAATLSGGNVTVTAGAGYTPGFGVTLPAITAKAITDSATWNLPAAPAGLQWDRRIVANGANQSEVITLLPTSASTLSSGSSWTSASWTSGVPNGAGSSARLAGSGGSISVDSDITLGYLQLDSTGSWTVAGAGTINFNATSGVAGIVAFTGSHTISAPVNFATDSRIGLSVPSASLTLSGPVSGSATVEKTGPGSLTLSGTSSPFSGTWSISGGSLNIDSDANLGAAGASLVLADSTVNVSGGWTSSRGITLNGGGATLSAGADSTLSGLITGSGGLTKNGANVLVLSGANSYTGRTTVTAGTLRQGAAGAVPAASAVSLSTGTTLDLAGNTGTIGSLAGAGHVTTGGASLTVGGDNTSSTFTGIVSGGGTFTKTGTGTQVVAPPVPSSGNIMPVDGNIVVNGGTLQFNNLSFSIVDLPANDITVNTGANLALAGTGSFGGEFDNSIHGGGTLTMLTGTVILGGPSDFTGGTVFQAAGGGTLALNDLGALGPAGTPIRFAAAGARDLGSAGILQLRVGGTFSHPITVDGYKTGRVDVYGNDVTLDRPISGDGVMFFSSSNANGTVRLNAVNTYKGTTNIDPSVTAILGADNAIPGDAGIGVNGTLDLNGHPETLGFLVGSGSIKLTGATLTVDNDNYDGNSFTGLLSGDGGLTKIGGGTQVLNVPAGKANTYTGPTLISQGSLQINGNIAGLSTSSAVTNNAELIFATTATASGVTAPAVPTYANNIAGTGEVQVALAAAETLAPTGNNTYSGGTRLTGGTLLVNSDANLGDPSGKITFYANATPVLKFASAFNTARAVAVENGTGTIDANNSNVTLTGAITGIGGLTAKGGTGSITVNNVRIGGTLTASTGTLRVAANGTNSGTSSAGGLTVTSGATLDLADNDMLVDYTGTSPLAGIITSFTSAYHAGAWDAPGLTSSAAASPAANGRTTLAIAENSALGFTSFDGLPVDSTAVLIKYTWYGDLNMDGKVNADDYALLDRGYAKQLTGWVNGDVNYDGVVNSSDYLLVDRAYALQSGTLDPALLAAREAQFGPAYVAALVASVPEPGTASLLGVVACGLLARRRRQRPGC